MALEMPDIIPTRQSFQCQVLRFGATGTAPSSRNFRSCSRPTGGCSPADTLSASISRPHPCRGCCLPCSPCSGAAGRRPTCSPARRWPTPDTLPARPLTMVEGFAMFDRLWPGVLGACVEIFDGLARALQRRQQRFGFLERSLKPECRQSTGSARTRSRSA